MSAQIAELAEAEITRIKEERDLLVLKIRKHYERELQLELDDKTMPYDAEIDRYRSIVRLAEEEQRFKVLDPCNCYDENGDGECQAGDPGIPDDMYCAREISDEDDGHPVPHGEWLQTAAGVDVHVHGDEPLTEEGRAAVGEVVEAAFAKLDEQGPPERFHRPSEPGMGHDREPDVSDEDAEPTEAEVAIAEARNAGEPEPHVGPVKNGQEFPDEEPPVLPTAEEIPAEEPPPPPTDAEVKETEETREAEQHAGSVVGGFRGKPPHKKDPFGRSQRRIGGEAIELVREWVRQRGTEQPFKATDVELDRSTRVRGEVLKALVDEGFLVKVGQTRATRYHWSGEEPSNEEAKPEPIEEEDTGADIEDDDLDDEIPEDDAVEPDDEVPPEDIDPVMSEAEAKAHKRAAAIAKENSSSRGLRAGLVNTADKLGTLIIEALAQGPLSMGGIQKAPHICFHDPEKVRKSVNDLLRHSVIRTRRMDGELKYLIPD